MLTPTLGSVDAHLRSLLAGATASTVDYLRDVLHDPDRRSKLAAIVDAFSTSQPPYLPSLPSREDPGLPPSSPSTTEAPSPPVPFRSSLSSSPSSSEEGYPSSPNVYQAPPHDMSPASAATSPATHHILDFYAKDSSCPPPDSPLRFPYSSSLDDASEELDLAAYLSPPAAHTSTPVWPPTPPATPVARGSPPEVRAEQHELPLPQPLLQGIDRVVEVPPMSQQWPTNVRNAPQPGLKLEVHVPQQGAGIVFTPGIGSVDRVADRSLAYPGQPQRASGFIAESLEPPVYGGDDADVSNATIHRGLPRPEPRQSPDYEGGQPSVHLSSPAVAAPPFVSPFQDGNPVHGTLAPPGCTPTLSSVRCPSSSPTPAEVSAMTVDVHHLLHGQLRLPRVALLIGSFPDRNTCKSHLSNRRHHDLEATTVLNRASGTLSKRRCNKRRTGVEYLEVEKRLSHWVQTQLIKPHVERLRISTVYADFVAVKHNLRLHQIDSWNTLMQLYFLFLYDRSSDTQRFKVPDGGLLDGFFLVVIYRCCEYLRRQPKVTFTRGKPVPIYTPALPSNEDLRKALDEAKWFLPSDDCTIQQCVEMDFTRLFHQLRVKSGALPQVPGANGQAVALVYDIQDDGWYDEPHPVRCEEVHYNIVDELEHPLPGQGGHPVALFHLQPEFDCHPQSTPAPTPAYVVEEPTIAASFQAVDVPAIVHRQDHGGTHPFKRVRVDVPGAFVQHPSAHFE